MSRKKHSRHSSGSVEQDDSSDSDDSVRERGGGRGNDRAEKRKSHKKHKRGKKERRERNARRSEDDASEENQRSRAAADRSDEDTNHWKSRLPPGSVDGYHRKGRSSPAQRVHDESTRYRSPSGSRRRSRDGHRSTRDQQQQPQQRHHQQPDSTTGSSRYGSDDRRGRPSARRTEYGPPSEHTGQRRATGRSDEESDSANRSGTGYKRQQHHHYREQSPTDGKGLEQQQKRRDRTGARYDESRTDKASRSNVDAGRNGLHRLHHQDKPRLAAGSGEGSHRSGSPAHRTDRDRSRSATRRRQSRDGSRSDSEADHQSRARAIKVERQSSSQPSTSGSIKGGHPGKWAAPRGAVLKQEDDDGKQYEWGGAKRTVKPEVVKDEPLAADEEPAAAEVEKQKPNFALSGKLTEEANKVNGVVINYAEPPGACKPKRRWRLYPMKGDQIMPTLYIHRQSCYLIGRDRKVCDLPIDHPSCSKQHAVLQYRLVPHERPDGTTSRTVRPYIIDLDSSNGTFVNYKKIEPKRYLELFEKDVLMFGFSSREYVLLEENSKDDDDGKGEG